MITSVIIEKEEKDSRHLVQLVRKQFPEIDVLTVCKTLPEAVLQIERLKPELLFLNPDLNPHTGFDLLEQTQSLHYKIIITTNQEKFAARAFDYPVIHYLEKPVDQLRLKAAINRFSQNVPTAIYKGYVESLKKNLKQAEVNSLEIYVPIKNGFHKILLGEIIYCKASSTSVTFYLVNQEKLIVSKTMNWIEARLKGYHFLRVHDSYLVNLFHVRKILHVREGAEIIMSEDTHVDVSKRRKAQFIKQILQLNIFSNG